MPVTLEARNLTFRYPGQERDVLHGFSLAVSPGQRIGIEAPSGYGKTTLCRLLAGYEQPQRGEILLNGKPLSTGKGYCPVQLIAQHPEQALDPRMKMRGVLEEAGMRNTGIINALGIREEWLERYPGELSAGELQRFCIARVLGSSVKFVLADEITAMLDPLTQSQLWHFLMDETQKRGIGLLAVSHSKSLLKAVCSRIISLVDEIPDRK